MGGLQSAACLKPFFFGLWARDGLTGLRGALATMERKLHEFRSIN